MLKVLEEQVPTATLVSIPGLFIPNHTFSCILAVSNFILQPLDHISGPVLRAPADFLFTSCSVQNKEERVTEGKQESTQPRIQDFMGTVPCRGPAHAVKSQANYLPSLCFSSLIGTIMIVSTSRKCSLD